MSFFLYWNVWKWSHVTRVGGAMYHQPDTLSSTEETLVSVAKIQQNKWKQAIVTKIKYAQFSDLYVAANYVPRCWGSWGNTKYTASSSWVFNYVHCSSEKEAIIVHSNVFLSNILCQHCQVSSYMPDNETTVELRLTLKSRLGFASNINTITITVIW